jgi:hypothetical protein
MRKVPKVVWRKLGKEWCWGQAHHDPRNPLIEIDPRLSPKRTLEVLCHEALHLALPELSESEIDRVGKAVSDVAWSQGYRMVVDTKHTTPVRISRNKRK